MNDISIRPMQDSTSDYQLLVEWFKNPEVTEFYTTHPVTYDEVREKYQPRVLDHTDFFPVIVEVNGTPVGYIQYYSVDPKEYGLNDYESIIKKYQRPFGIDIFLGAKNCLNQGIGTTSLKLVVSKIFTTTECQIILIDPNAKNHRAIHCYENVGFKTLGVMKEHDLYQGHYTDSLLMILERS